MRLSLRWPQSIQGAFVHLLDAKVPMSSIDANDLCFLPATELAARIRRRDLSPVEVALSRCRRKSATGLQLLKFQAAVTASRHVLIAAARKVRCVEAEVRWRWTLKVLKTAA
jgi:hypothetical protein